MQLKMHKKKETKKIILQVQHHLNFDIIIIDLCIIKAHYFFVMAAPAFIYYLFKANNAIKTLTVHVCNLYRTY